ncbi:MAG: hypothetical protein MJ214_02125 [Bacilli bacterium]|nr:hypothetical protein [Bacilli bacterium]
MKKLLIAKLAVVTLSFSGLIACSNGDNPGPGPDPDPTVYHTLTFTGEHCLMKDSKGKPVTEPVKFEAGQSANFYLAGEDESYLLPTENQVKAYVTGGEEEFKGTWKYNPSDGALSVKMTADVTVTATSSPDLKNYRLITFKGTDCHMKYGDEGEPITEVLLKEGTDVKYKLEGETDFFLTPAKNHVVVTVNESGEVWKEGTNYTYDETYGCIGFKVTDNITITASSLANVPVAQGKDTLYFKLGSGSAAFEDYESIYFTGVVHGWQEGINATECIQCEDNPEYYYFQIDTPEWGENYGAYELVRGLNKNSGVSEEKQGLQWVDLYKSDEIRALGKDPVFDYPAVKQRISLGTHTFSTSVIIPSDIPLNNYKLSVEFADPIPEDCKVLIFGSMNGWITPGGEHTVEEDEEIIKNAEMTLDATSGRKIFTYTYDELCPNVYDYLICVEKETSIQTIEWNKTLESYEPDDPDGHNLNFLVYSTDGDDYTNKLFSDDHCAHFKDPFADYSVTALKSTEITHGTVKINGSGFYRQGAEVSAAIIPDDGYVIPEEGHEQEGIVVYADEECTEVLNPKIEKYDAKAGTFAFSLKGLEKYTALYVEVYCHSESMSCSIDVKVDGEKHETKTPLKYGEKATVIFSNATGGCHIAKDQSEFFSTHIIIGDYTNARYIYENKVGTLTFDVHSNIIIRGSAPKDSAIL